MQAPPASPHVLLVEDEEAIRDLVGFHLSLSDFTFTAAIDGPSALDASKTRQFDVIILDLVLPGLDGLTLCEAIRRDGPNREVPILMLTARGDESDRVVGLDSGADDYLVKPFAVRELMARLRALLRRPSSSWRRQGRSRDSAPISELGVTLDSARRVVTVDGQAVNLTPQEFSLLEVLISRPGIVFDRDELLTRVWDDEVFVTARSVDALVKRLRRKIELDPAQPTRIVTAWGTGYKFGHQ
jgi:two-component system, OmpR family, response regulator ResD